MIPRAVCLLLIFVISAFGQTNLFFIPTGSNPNGTIVAQPPAQAYDASGNLWVKTSGGLDNIGWEHLLAGEAIVPLPPAEISLSNQIAVLLREARGIPDLTHHVRQGIDRMLWTKYDTNTQWRWLNDDSTINTNCWVFGIDFSGMAVEGRIGLPLITPKHAICVKHSPPELGTPIIWLGVDGIRHTNWRETVVTVEDSELMVVVLSNDCPATVRPFLVFPTNVHDWTYARQLPTYEEPLMTVQFRGNFRRFSVRPGIDINDTLMVMNLLKDATIPFADDAFTGGDSGSPRFAVVMGRPLLIGPIATEAGQGPWVSIQDQFQWVQAACGTNYPISTMNLEHFKRYHAP